MRCCARGASSAPSSPASVATSIESPTARKPTTERNARGSGSATGFARSVATSISNNPPPASAHHRCSRSFTASLAIWRGGRPSIFVSVRHPLPSKTWACRSVRASFQGAAPKIQTRPSPVSSKSISWAFVSSFATGFVSSFSVNCRANSALPSGVTRQSRLSSKTQMSPRELSNTVRSADQLCPLPGRRLISAKSRPASPRWRESRSVGSPSALCDDQTHRTSPSRNRASFFGHVEPFAPGHDTTRQALPSVEKIAPEMLCPSSSAEPIVQTSPVPSCAASRNSWKSSASARTPSSSAETARNQVSRRIGHRA